MVKSAKSFSTGGTLPPAPPQPLSKEDFGRRLYKLMSAKGWRQAELARRADIGRDSVSNYIKGKSYPTPMNLEKMATALGVTGDDILPGHASSAILATRPDFEMKAIPGDPHHVWIRCDRAVTVAVGNEVSRLILGDAANAR